MVSSAVLSMASVAWIPAAIPSAALGMVVNLTEDEKKLEFNSAVKAAMKHTREQMTSPSKQAILGELDQLEVEPDSLGELIKKAEAYQTQYCTEADVKEILIVFDNYFKIEIAKRPVLSSLYVLSTNFATLDKLKAINQILINSENKLSDIQANVSKTNRILAQAQVYVLGCLNSVAFILVAMAIFLGMGIFSSSPYSDRTIVLIAPICYGISDFLMFCLSKGGYALISLREGFLKKYKIETDVKVSKIFLTVTMSVFLTVSCFWIILWSIGVSGTELVFPTLYLIFGQVVSVILKEARFVQQSPVSEHSEPNRKKMPFPSESGKTSVTRKKAHGQQNSSLGRNISRREDGTVECENKKTGHENMAVYETLRSHIISCENRISNERISMYAVYFALLAFAVNYSWLILVSFLILIVFQTLINMDRIMISKASIYIKEFFEENSNIHWETWHSDKYFKTYRKNYKNIAWRVNEIATSLLAFVSFAALLITSFQEYRIEELLMGFVVKIIIATILLCFIVYINLSFDHKLSSIEKILEDSAKKLHNDFYGKFLTGI